MDLEQELEKCGYSDALAQYESLLRQRDFLRENAEDFAGDAEAEAAIAELEASVHKMYAALKRQYDATVRQVDAENDLDFAREVLVGRLEDIADAAEEHQPEIADWLRRRLKGEDPGPMPKPSPIDKKEEASNDANGDKQQ